MIRHAKIDVTKINKNNLVERSFKNKNGDLITVKELEIELLDIKEPKVLSDTEKGTLKKVGFITEKSFINPEGKWENGVTLGDITVWEKKVEQAKVEQKTPEVKDDIQYPTEDINIDDIPF